MIEDIGNRVLARAGQRIELQGDPPPPSPPPPVFIEDPGAGQGRAKNYEAPLHVRREL